MAKDGEPIQEVPLSRALNTGISYQATLPGLVSEVEEREAAIFNGYTWREWRDLDYFDRVRGAAHFRVHHLIQLHNAETEIKAAETRRRMQEASLAPGG